METSASSEARSAPSPWAVLLLVALLPFVACNGGAPPRQAIFILLDAARADRFSCYGHETPTTPNIDRLAREGLLFRNHFSEATHTRKALPTFLYSRYYTAPIFPASPDVPLETPGDLFRRLDDEARALTGILSDAGLRTCAISAHRWIKEGTRFADEFDELHDLTLLPSSADGSTGWSTVVSPYSRAEVVVDRALEWIEEHLDDEYFLYLHFMDTHFPHPFGEDAQALFGQRAPPVESFRADGRPKSSAEALQGEERRYLDALYDGDLQYADRQVGRLLEFLEKRGRLDDVLLLVTSDHGEHLLEVPGRFEHSGPWLDAVGHVPLIVRYPPKLQPGVVESLTASVDLLPTVLSLLDVELPEGVHPDGIDVTLPSPADRLIFRPSGVRGPRYKCLFSTSDRRLLSGEEPVPAAVRGRLYDLSADPEELVNVWDENPEVVRSMVGVYRDRMADPHTRFETASTTEQPTRAFAIGAAHFDPEPALTPTPADLKGRPCEDLAGGWTRNRQWWNPYLLASRGDDPMILSFPIPDGPYRLTASARGTAELQIEGETTIRRISGNPFLPEEPVLTGASDIGTVDVDLGVIGVAGGRFSIQVRKSADQCFLLRRFGFVPLTGSAAAEITPEERERLRALGYVN